MQELSIRFTPIQAPSAPIETGALANGDQIGATKHHLTRDGKPWYPVMGEFHYSRCPADEWETELRKMKAAGVQIAATYVFWIHHEEDKGIWRTDGNLNLRRFLKLCKKTGLDVLLRIGPWAHGECRNGGFPDWLQHDTTIAARTDDPKYLALVRALFRHIFDAANGLLLTDGGPIIGIQLENEYGHCGGESGGKGLDHMRTLKRLAAEAGFLVPLYTATGWGGGNVASGEMLPVMGGYADAPWDRSLRALPANPNYLLLPAPNDPMIASDWQREDKGFTYPVDAYPYLTAELGGGIQCTVHRRPLISAADTAAQALCKLGTGANLLGYYMFHGGTHPMGKHGTLQESTATGSYTDVPVRSYDFQAPLGESGSLHESYSHLKALHMLVSDAGESLAGSMCYYPECVVQDAENLTDVRFCVRWNAQTKEGFLFINNHQRLRQMHAHHGVRFTIQAGDEPFALPPMDIPSGFWGVIPVNLKVDGGRLRTTNAQLLCRLKGIPVLYTWDDRPPESHFDGGALPSCLVLTRQEALHAWRVGDRLYIAEGCLYEEEDHLTLIADAPRTLVRRYPDGASLTAEAKPVAVDAHAEALTRDANSATYRISIGEVPADQVEDMLLEIDFTGDHADVYLGDECIADWYTTGQRWQLALKRLGYPRTLTLRVYTVTRPTYFEIPEPEGMRVNAVTAHARYRITLQEGAFFA